ncbi:MAG: hypothetical protein QXZ25_01560 [Candidatus Bathyarchaeia archaeon]
MGEKKLISRNVVIVLGIIVVILLAGLVVAAVNYTSIINGKNDIIAAKDSQIQTLTNQMIQLQAWLDGNKTEFQQEIQQLQERIQELEKQSIQFQQRIMNMQTFFNSLMMPKLVKVDLRAYDNRTWLGAPYLYVCGYICNVGTYTALNSTIHVVAYQSGGVVAIDIFINLGDIDGESWKQVDSKIYYGGSELVNWTLTLEWASPPIPV